MLMQNFQSYPEFSQTDIGKLNEVFNHEIFLNADQAQRKYVMLKSAEFKYNDEIKYPWDHYFGHDLTPLLEQKEALDLGCFTGGRSLAWLKRYGLKSIAGVDVKKVYIEAAELFAAMHNAKACFEFGFGESLPFNSEMFDAVLSFDVFEHVQNIQKTLDECHRVLKSGGRLFLVFPGYFHPVEHHLSLVTKAPCIHWFFSGKTLIKAYHAILRERGDNTYWYRRQSPDLEHWERCHSINGTTLFQFKKLLKKTSWKIIENPKKAIGSIGRNASRRSFISSTSRLLRPLTSIPGIQDLFVHRIVYILEK